MRSEVTQISNAEKFPHLHKVFLFNGLPEQEVTNFLNFCFVEVFTKPTYLLRQGETTDGFYILASGYVNVIHTGTDGQSVLLNRIGPGDTTGEIEAICGGRCAANCETAGHAAALFCPSALILQSLKSINFVQNIISVCYERMMRDNKYRLLDHNLTVPQRIGVYLKVLANQNMEIHESQAFLAHAVSCSRQTINKELSLLRDQNIITIQRECIQILDVERLNYIIDYTSKSKT